MNSIIISRVLSGILGTLSSWWFRRYPDVFSLGSSSGQIPQSGFTDFGVKLSLCWTSDMQTLGYLSRHLAGCPSDLSVKHSHYWSQDITLTVCKDHCLDLSLGLSEVHTLHCCRHRETAFTRTGTSRAAPLHFAFRSGPSFSATPLTCEEVHPAALFFF